MWRRVWIWRRKLKSGVGYCLRWYDESGHIRSEAVGSDRKLAEKLQKQREHELNTGKLSRVSDVKFDEFRREEIEVLQGRMAPTTIHVIERTLRDFAETCKPKKMSSITPRMVEAYFARRLKKVATATANKDLRTLKASFERARKRGYLESNPAESVRQVREPERDIRVLTPDEVGKLLAACGTVRWKALVALAVTTGLRIGEILALRRTDVDFEAGVVHIRNTKQHLTKSRKNRAVALLPVVGGLLKRLPKRGEMLFSTREGRGMRNNVQREFKQIVTKAGIAYCTMHDLRRTFVSQLAMAGVNEAVVQKLAGHASMSTTLKYYTNIEPQALQAAQAKLPFEKILRDISYPYHGGDQAESPEKGDVVKLDIKAS